MIGPGRAGAACVFDTLDRDALAAIGIDLDTVRGKIEAVFGPGSLRARPQTPRRARGWRRARCRTQDLSGHLPLTPWAKRCLEQSLRQALALHSGVEHLALALIATRSSAAAHILSTIAPHLDQQSRVPVIAGQPLGRVLVRRVPGCSCPS